METIKNGVIFTPKKIADEMVEILNPKIDESIVDFSCGIGAFPLAILNFFKSKNISQKSMIDYIETKMFCYDIEPNYVSLCKESLAKFIHKEYGITNIKLNVFQKDSLTLDKKFVCSIGNPPYIRYQHLSHKLRTFLKDQFNSCKNGNIDLYYAFLELALKLTTRSIHITSDSFMYNSSGKLIRNLLGQHISLLKQYKRSDIFNASTYPAIIYTNKNNSPNFEYICKTTKKTIPKSKLGKNPWNHLEMETNDSNKNTIKDICRITCGIATLCDKVFIRNIIEKDDLYYTIKSAYDSKLYKIEKSITKHYLKLSKVKSIDDLNDSGTRIIFPYDSNKKAYTESIMKSKFPYTLNYFNKHKSILANRDKGKKVYEQWYAFGRRQSFTVDLPKSYIIIPALLKEGFKPTVVINNLTHYIVSSGFILSVNDDSNFDKVCKLLLSDSFFNYIKQIASVKGASGDWYSINKKILENFPLT